MDPQRTRPTRLAVLTLVLALALAACAGDAPSADDDPTTDDTGVVHGDGDHAEDAGTQSEGNGPDADTDRQVAETIQDVDYYYACGNEVLELPDGRRFYPFVDQDAVDEDVYLSSTSSPTISVQLVGVTLAVPSPGPGDATGTLTIYEDGTARFVSDSGTEAWLSDEEQTYDWVC